MSNDVSIIKKGEHDAPSLLVSLGFSTQAEEWISYRGRGKFTLCNGGYLVRSLLCPSWAAPPFASVKKYADKTWLLRIEKLITQKEYENEEDYWRKWGHVSAISLEVFPRRAKPFLPVCRIIMSLSWSRMWKYHWKMVTHHPRRLVI